MSVCLFIHVWEWKIVTVLSKYAKNLVAQDNIYEFYLSFCCDIFVAFCCSMSFHLDKYEHNKYETLMWMRIRMRTMHKGPTSHSKLISFFFFCVCICVSFPFCFCEICTTFFLIWIFHSKRTFHPFHFLSFISAHPITFVLDKLHRIIRYRIIWQRIRRIASYHITCEKSSFDYSAWGKSTCLEK